MKDNLIEQEITRIKEILYNGGTNETTINESTEVISEQLFPAIERYLGKAFATKMETNLGDDVMKNLEVLFQKGSANFMKNSANEIVILAKSGTQVPMKTVRAALNAVAEGKMTADDVAKLLPKQLKDGTDFATVFKRELKKAKPKPIAPKPATPKPATPKPAAPKQNSVLKPKVRNTPKPVYDEIPSDADEIIKKTAASSAEAAAYMSKIDIIPLDGGIKKMLKLNYNNFHDLTPSELLTEGTKMAKQLNELKYGWLQKSWNKILENPTAFIKKTGLGIASLYIVYELIQLTASGVAMVDSARKWVEDKTGTKGSDVLPNLKSSSGEFTNDENGIRDFLKKAYPTKKIDKFNISRDTDNTYSVTYTEKINDVPITSKPIIFNYRNGTFSK